MYLLYFENSKVMPKKRPPNKFDGLRVEFKNNLNVQDVCG